MLYLIRNGPEPGFESPTCHSVQSAAIPSQTGSIVLMGEFLLETRKSDGLGFPMIQMNREIMARVVKDLETVRKLRKAEGRIERVSAKVTAKINKTMRDSAAAMASRHVSKLPTKTMVPG